MQSVFLSQLHFLTFSLLFRHSDIVDMKRCAPWGINVEADIDLPVRDVNVVDTDILPYAVVSDIVIDRIAPVVGNFRSGDVRIRIFQANPCFESIIRIVHRNAHHLMNALFVSGRRPEVGSLIARPRRFRRIDARSAVDAISNRLRTRMPFRPVAVVRGIPIKSRIIEQIFLGFRGSRCGRRHEDAINIHVAAVR